MSSATIIEGYRNIVVEEDDDRAWRGSPETEEAVTRNWETESKKPNTRNEPMIRLDSLLKTGDTLRLRTSRTDFAHHRGTRQNKEISQRANPIYVSANLITLDDRMLFGRRAAVLDGQGQYNIAAGGLNQYTDVADGRPSLNAGILREILEEFGYSLAPSITSIRSRMAFAPPGQANLSFLYTVELGIKVSEAKDRFDEHVRRLRASGVEPEMDRFHDIGANPKAIEQALKTSERYRPSIVTMFEHFADTGRIR